MVFNMIAFDGNASDGNGHEYVTLKSPMKDGYWVEDLYLPIIISDNTKLWRPQDAGQKIEQI